MMKRRADDRPPPPRCSDRRRQTRDGVRVATEAIFRSAGYSRDTLCSGRSEKEVRSDEGVVDPRRSRRAGSGLDSCDLQGSRRILRTRPKAVG